MPHIISANRLLDGRIVFRDAAGDWIAEPAKAARFDGKDALAAGLAAAQADFDANRVIEIEAVEVKVQGEAVCAVTMRDKVRLSGPSVLQSAPPSPVQVASEQNDVSI